MEDIPIIYNLDWKAGRFVDDLGVVLAGDSLPFTALGIQNKLLCIQIVTVNETTGAITPYTGLAAGTVCDFFVDDDYKNPPAPVPLPSTGWENVTGSEYRFFLPIVAVAAKFDGVDAVDGTAGSLVAGEWAYDSDGQYIHVHLADSTDPSTKADGFVTFTIVASSDQTVPFLWAQGDDYNSPDSFPDGSGGLRDPLIENGEMSFILNANTAYYYARIGTSAEVPCFWQIGFFGAGVDAPQFDIKSYKGQFICKNKMTGVPATDLEYNPWPSWTKAESDARYVRYGEGTMKPFTVSSSELTGRTITITHSLSTLTPFVYVYTDTGEGTGPIKPIVVDADNVTLDFEGFPTTFNDYTVLITGGMYTMPDVIPLSLKGAANGVATLNPLSQVPDAQCPDIAVKAMGNWDADANDPALSDATGSKGELYLVSVTGTQDLGGGSVVYTAGESILHNGTVFEKRGVVLGETSTTAHRGDQGATAYTHSQTTTGNPHNIDSADTGSDPAGTASTLVGTHASSNDHPEATQSAKGMLSATDKTTIDGWAINFPQPTQFYNNTGVEIPACSWINAGSGGVDSGTGIVKGFLADASVPSLSTSVIGITTAATPDGTVGVAYDRATVPCNTTGLTVGSNLYLSDTTPGAGTMTRPLHPNTIVILGTIQVVGTSGSVLARVSRFSRAELSRDYGFTSNGIGAGVHDLAGFYDWATTSVTLTQASLTQTYGTVGRTKAAHVGIVPNGPGTVDTGQVGLRVTGTLDSETGSQTASQTAIITDDITTLTANVMAETAEKFSGQVTLELYVVSGTPTTYSLTFNYGYSKYEDFHNKNFTLDEIEATWQGNAADSTFNIEILHHKAAGWTYAATGFTPGDGVIAARLTDQQIESAVANNADGAWKRNQLATYVAGNDSEGIIMRITTGAINTIQNANINLSVLSEDLT